jgi:hypothetical protein
MDNTKVKAETQEESQELSRDEIKQDYNPHKQSPCAAFLRTYKSSFIKNFNKVCQDKCTCDLFLKELNIEGDYLYDVMFNPDIDVSENEVNSLFKKLIHHAAQVDVVLNQAWLQMIDDYVSHLRQLNGRVDEITSLTALMNELFKKLDEAYYEMRKPVNVTIPHVDKAGDPYKRIISKFKRYIEDEPEADEEFTDLQIHSFFRSTPLKMAATVDKIEEESVTFNVHPYVAIALQKVAVAFISSPVHDDIYKAYADNIDIENRKVRFTSFISQNNNSDNRKHVRVELSHITRAMIIGKQAEAEGIIYNISEAACAIYVRNVNMNNFEPGTPVRFITKLPDTSSDNATEIDTMATVLKSYKQGKNDLHAHRIVIQYNNEPSFFSGLANYISSRQREIIRELKDISEVTESENSEDSSHGKGKAKGA